MINLEKIVEVTAKKEKGSIFRSIKTGTRRLVKFTLGTIVVVSVLIHEVNQDSHINKVVDKVMQQREEQITYTVTGKKSEDGYIQTQNVNGQDVYLSDVELDLAKLKVGDKVEIKTNAFGEVITVKKISKK